MSTPVKPGLFRARSLGDLPAMAAASSSPPSNRFQDDLRTVVSQTGTTGHDIQNTSTLSQSEVVRVLKEEREFSDSVGAVFDKLIVLLEDKRGGSRICVREDNPPNALANALTEKKIEVIAPPVVEQPAEQLEVTADDQAQVSPSIVLVGGVANYCMNIIRRTFAKIAQFYQRDKSESLLNKLPLLAQGTPFKPKASMKRAATMPALPLMKKIEKVWEDFIGFFTDIREGAEITTGTLQRRASITKKTANETGAKPLTLYQRIDKILDRVWKFLLEIQEGVEVSTGTQKKAMQMEEKLPELDAGFIDSIVAYEKRHIPAEETNNSARTEYARKFENITNAKISNSIRDVIESKVFSWFPYLGFFQSSKRKAENMETYYALKTLFGGGQGEYLGRIAKKAGINIRTKCNWKLPWTRNDIQKIVRQMASINKKELQDRFKDIEKRRLCGGLLDTLREQGSTLLEERSEIFFDTWRIARCSLKATSHFMNHPPDTTGIQKGLDHSDYIKTRLMEDEERIGDQWEAAKDNSEDRKKLQSDFFVGFAQENLGHPVETDSIFFTPWGLYKNHKNLDKGGALVNYYKPLSSGMSHLIAFPGMRVSDSMSTDDWLSRRNVFYEKMGDQSYKAIKVNLNTWLSEISDRIERNNRKLELRQVPDYKQNDSVTLLAKSLGTTYAQRLLVDQVAKRPIDQAILIAGAGMEETAHTNFIKALDARSQVRDNPLELTYYRSIKDVVPTVGGDGLGTMDNQHKNLITTFNLYSNERIKEAGEDLFAEEKKPQCFLKDTVTKEPQNAPIYRKWQGNVTRAFAHASNIWAVLHKLAEYDHLGQFHRWRNADDQEKYPINQALPSSLHLQYNGRTGAAKYTRFDGENSTEMNTQPAETYATIQKYLRQAHSPFNKHRSILL